MYLRKNRIIIIILSFFIAFNSISFAANLDIKTTYTCIKASGLIQDMRAQLGPGEKLIKSKDNTTAYIVQRIPIRNETQLLSLMGSSNEQTLTDAQKGLLESYRFSKSSDINDLKQRIPANTSSLAVDLVDITGFEDTQKYPSLTRDFWPVNRTSLNYVDGDYKQSILIRISGVNSIGWGSQTAKKMSGTFAHEFGHALDYTQIEHGGYGKDNSHYVNEKIAKKASFAEGFANFIKMLLFPDTEDQFRRAVRTVKIERPEGGYDEVGITDGTLKGQELLQIEAINSLIFNSLYRQLPGGDKKVLDSFAMHNNSESHMASYLKNLISDYPQYGKNIAKILDDETFGYLSDDDFIKILGNSKEVTKFLASRNGDTLPELNTPAVSATRKPHTSSKPKIYKWTDANGVMHFTDTPPNGLEYTTMDSKVDSAGDAVLNKSGGNPFKFN